MISMDKCRSGQMPLWTHSLVAALYVLLQHCMYCIWTHSRHRDHTAVSCTTLDPPLPWRTGGGMRQGGVGCNTQCNTCNTQCNTYEAFPIKLIAKSHKNAHSGFWVETFWSQTDPATDRFRCLTSKIGLRPKWVILQNGSRPRLLP